MKRTKLQEMIKSGREAGDIVWNIFNRIDEYEYLFEEYLKRLKEFGLITQDNINQFRLKTFKSLKDDILENVIIQDMQINLGEEYLKEISETETKISKLLKKIEKEIYDTLVYLDPITIEIIGPGKRKLETLYID